MRDIIDERNEKERISKSIIKFWNVNYVPVQPEPKEPEKEALSDEIVADEADMEALDDALYNETTGSYSGAYGLESIEDEVTKGQIDKILKEKDGALRHLIDENSKDYFWEES